MLAGLHLTSTVLPASWPLGSAITACEVFFFNADGLQSPVHRPESSIVTEVCSAEGSAAWIRSSPMPELLLLLLSITTTPVVGLGSGGARDGIVPP